MEKVEEKMRTRDETGIRLKLEKCQTPQEQTEWVDFILSRKGIKPIDEKIQAITERIKPKNLKVFSSFLGQSTK